MYIFYPNVEKLLGNFCTYFFFDFESQSYSEL